MRSFAIYAIFVVTVTVPVNLRAELLNQNVTIGHYSSISIAPPFVGAPSPGEDFDGFTDQIVVGQTSDGQTSSQVDGSFGRFEASTESFVNFGPPFWWGEWSASFSASSRTSYVISATSGARLVRYSFNSTEPGTLFVRQYSIQNIGNPNAVGATATFIDAVTQTYDYSNDRVIDAEFDYLAQTPYGIDSDGRPLFQFDHTLDIAVPSLSGTAGRGDWVASAQSFFIWGHGVLPGSTPDVPLLPSGITDDGGFIIDVITDGTAEDVVYIDPVMAIGYDYESASIAFRSVLIPGALPGGDDTFELLFGTYAFTLTAGIEFDFTSFDPDGIFEFSIRGIDPGELLDPSDPTAFVTGVTFMEAGISEVIMTPVTVPEVPSALLAMSPIVMGVVVRFLGKRRVSSASNA